MNQTHRGNEDVLKRFFLSMIPRNKRVSWGGDAGRRSRLMVGVFLCTVLFLASSCSTWKGSARLPENVPLPDPGNLYKQILKTSGQIKSLKGTAKVRIRNEERKARVEAVIACDRKGRLRFEVFDFLGHVIFLALIRDTGFLAYSVAENRFLEAPEEEVSLREVLGVSMKGKELIALALGSPFFVPMESPALHVQKEKGFVLLTAFCRENGLEFQILVDGKGRAIRSVLTCRTGTRGRSKGLRVDFERYKKVNGIEFPHRIRVADPKEAASFEVIYEKVVFNEALSEELFRFNPPEDAEEMTW